MNRALIVTGFVTATSVLSLGDTAAALLNPNSFYQMTLDVGSSITMGALPGSTSSIMTDNSATLNSTPYGVIDGLAGVLKFQTDVTGENLVVTSFQVDPVNTTAGGDFFQYSNSLATMAGQVDSAGNMSLDLTGRVGVFEFFSNLIGAQSLDNQFTSGSACNLLGCINGSSVTPAGNPNEFKVTLVSAGELGASWGVFTGTSYFEVWESQNTITLLGPATVPVPAAVWLFGSGLIGLIGVARWKVRV